MADAIPQDPAGFCVGFAKKNEGKFSINNAGGINRWHAQITWTPLHSPPATNVTITVDSFDDDFNIACAMVLDAAIKAKKQWEWEGKNVRVTKPPRG